MNIKFLTRRNLLTAGFCFIVMTSANVFAQDIPANLQAALFKKIFSFDKTLSAKGNIDVAVIGDGADIMVSAFKGIGVNAKTENQVPGGVSVVYLMSGGISKIQTTAKGILFISGSQAYVEGGKVSIGLGIEGGKPKIIVNMGKLKAEGQELSADLLKIAKVIN